MRRFLVLFLFAFSLIAGAGSLSEGTVRRLRPVFEGKHALVTGGSSGIGAALAEHLVQLGASVLIMGRHREPLLAEQAKLREMRISSNQRIEILRADVCHRDEWRSAFDTFLSTGFRFDIVVNNAGISHPALTADIVDSAVDSLIDVNFRAPVDITRYFMGLFHRRGTGMLGYVASLAGHVNIAGYSVYGGTKAALVAFADTVRNEFAATEVSVSVILPPDVATPMLDEENNIKPSITMELSASKPLSADQVSEALLTGMARRQFKIFPGAHARFVDRMVRYAPGCVRWMIDRTVRRFAQD